MNITSKPNTKNVALAAKFWIHNKGHITQKEVCKKFSVPFHEFSLAAREIIFSEACVSPYPIQELPKPIFHSYMMSASSRDPDMADIINVIYRLVKGPEKEIYFIE